MTQADRLSTYLEPLGLSAWRFYHEVGSTNDCALDWLQSGAPDWSLVIGDAQTAGRGRHGRQWVTEPGQSLAFSLVLRLSRAETAYFPRLAALGALGLIKALSAMGLSAALKWPNDVLLTGKKVAGVLVEADWQADRLVGAVIGVGVNVSPSSVPPADRLRYPATAIESVLGAEVDRWALLGEILRGMRDYRAILGEDALIDAWNATLAWRNALVKISILSGEPQTVRLVGVNPIGELTIETDDGRRVDVVSGEILWDEDPS